MLMETKLTNRISYIKATENPLSADVGIIEGEEFLWLYDVGNRPEVTQYLNSLAKPKCVIISHFHADHIGGLSGLEYNRLYQGATTKKYTHAGETVSGEIIIEDGITLRIFELPSSHAQGSVGLEVGNHAFLGDGIYSTVKQGRVVYNQGILQAEIKVLKSLRAENFVLSHDERYAVPRGEVIRELEEIYSRRTKNDPYITLEE